MLLNDLLNKTVDDIVYLKPQNINEPEIPVSFNNTLSQVLISLSRIIIDENVKINSDFSRLKAINYTPANLERILLIAITNALKSRHPKKQPIINISTYLDNDNAILEISDNGLCRDLNIVKPIENIKIKSCTNKEAYSIKIYL